MSKKLDETFWQFKTKIWNNCLAEGAFIQGSIQRPAISFCSVQYGDW